MDSKSFKVSLKRNPSISMNVMAGHFTTSNAHISHYLDVSALKANAKLACEVAKELAEPYVSSVLIETIICLERTEVIGAFLAQELTQSGIGMINSGAEIYVVTPISNDIGQLSFQSSMIKQILNKNILLLTNTVSSGRSLNSALDCISYYHGKVAGISALFMASPNDSDYKLNTIFTPDDIPNYKIYKSRNCEMCRAGQKLDALVSSEGYTKI